MATASYDHSSGLYASGSAIAAATRHDGAQLTGYQVYAGYARRFDADSSWEVGVSRTDVTEHFRPKYGVEYNELYAGVSTRRVSAHLYYSPNYLGENVGTLYATTTATFIPAPGWKAFAHAGILIPVDLRRRSEIRRTQFDLSAGLARRIGDIELQGQVTYFGPDDDLVAGKPQGRAAAAVSATLYF